ncbi:hypothetical protein ACQKNB_19930 [Lysinibacillus xylanilyticus]
MGIIVQKKSFERRLKGVAYELPQHPKTLREPCRSAKNGDAYSDIL